MRQCACWHGACSLRCWLASVAARASGLRVRGCVNWFTRARTEPVVVLGRPDQSDELKSNQNEKRVAVTGLSPGLRVAGRGYKPTGRTRAKGPALDSQEVSMTMQSPTASLNAPAGVPALRSMFRRMIDAIIEGAPAQGLPVCRRLPAGSPGAQRRFPDRARAPVHGPVAPRHVLTDRISNFPFNSTSREA